MRVSTASMRIATGSMKAIVCRRPGRPDGLRLEEIDRPPVPDDGVLVRVRASSINPVDFFPLTPIGFMTRGSSARSKPKAVLIGTDFAGTVEAVGKSVIDFKPGDEVFGGKPGAFAEYVVVAEKGGIARKPANATFEQAAAVPVAATTGLQALRDQGRVQPGQRVLINGASGGVGTFAIQIAKALGAEVTAVCSPRNLDSARSLGADRVIDYSKEDFTRRPERYDVLLDIAGSHSWSECTRVLKPKGTFVLAGASAYTVFGGNRAMMHILRFRLSSLFSSQRFAFFIAKLNREDLTVLGEFLSAGKLTAAIDRQYALEHVAEAMHYMGEGHARGKIVVRMA